jgi:hypothetical protein
MDALSDALSDFINAASVDTQRSHTDSLAEALRTALTSSTPTAQSLEELVVRLSAARNSLLIVPSNPPHTEREMKDYAFREVLVDRLSTGSCDELMNSIVPDVPPTGDRPTNSTVLIAEAEGLLSSLAPKARSAVYVPRTTSDDTSFGEDEYIDDNDAGYRVKDALDNAAPTGGGDDELLGACIVSSDSKTLLYDYRGGVVEVDRLTSVSTPQPPHSTGQMKTMWLPVIYEAYKTGFETSKELDTRVGTVVAGRYEIQGFLGSAAFSTAVKAIDLITKSMVCLKIIRNEKDFFDQSLDEIKILKYLNESGGDMDKKHCLRLIDFLYFKEHLILVTELLRDNLYDFSKFQRSQSESCFFTIGTIQKIAHQILTAVEYIHSLGIIHCDLKPENILYRSYVDCDIKVIDFGSSCFNTDKISTYVQSRSYRAPEVILGCRPYTAKIDLWSVGCILAELWTGSVLFANTNSQSYLARIQGIIGRLPDHMVRSGHNSLDLFANFDTQDIFVQQLGDDLSETSHVQILIPKSSSLLQRMRINDDQFLDFLVKLLQIDPDLRMSAAEALGHPWITHSRYPDGLN